MSTEFGVLRAKPHTSEPEAGFLKIILLRNNERANCRNFYGASFVLPICNCLYLER